MGRLPGMTKAWLLLLGVAAVQGCQRAPNSPGSSAPGYSLVCVLSNVVSPTRVAVYAVTPLDSPTTFVKGAEVVLWWSGGSVRLAEAKVESSLWGGTFEAYADTAQQIEVLPRRMFFLRVVCPDQTELNGQTTVPGDFAILTPRSGDTLVATGAHVDFHVSWSSCADAGGYVVEIAPQPAQWGEGPTRWLRHSYTVLGDTTWSGRILVSEKLYGTFRISVMAFDRNYYEHVFAGVAAAGVENAFGVMGSCWTKAVTVSVRGSMGK